MQNMRRASPGRGREEGQTGSVSVAEQFCEVLDSEPPPAPGGALRLSGATLSQRPATLGARGCVAPAVGPGGCSKGVRLRCPLADESCTCPRLSL